MNSAQDYISHSDSYSRTGYDRIICWSLLLCLFCPLSWSADVELRIPIIEDTPSQHKYFHELLKQAFEEAGHNLTLHTLHYPQLRVVHLMNTGGLSIMWMIESEERNQKYLPIPVGLTEGLIGKRVLFIKKEDQPLYSGVKTLEDFRHLNKVGAMGESWFDVKVWQANNLKYATRGGNWEDIFVMLPKGKLYDYFSRGVNEILAEAHQYPDLYIEETLVLEYERDFYFYLSLNGNQPGAMYKDVITDVLMQAKENGMIEHLVQKYWGANLNELNFEQRTKLKLITPK